MEKILNKIYDIHDIECNQKYGDSLPYSFHLKATVAQVRLYIKEVEGTFDRRILSIAAAGHDLFEGDYWSYRDLLSYLFKEANYLIDDDIKRTVEIVYLCTDLRGRTREERHSLEFYRLLREDELAVYVKLCDVKANVLYSLLTGSSMYNKYQKEFPGLYEKLYKVGEYEKLWDDIRELLKQ